MSNANIDAVQRIYEAFGAGDVDTILGLPADDVDFGSESEARIAPWHGQRTEAEVPAFFLNWHHWWSFRDGKVVLYRESEDTALVAERLAS